MSDPETVNPSPATPPTRLGGAVVELFLTPDLAARTAIGFAYTPGELDVYVLAAALGLCWPKLGRRVPWNRDVRAYGEKVLNLLMDPKKTTEPLTFKAIPTDFVPVATRALVLILEALVSVEGAAGFSGAGSSQETPSSSRGSSGDNSRSNAPGTAIRVGSGPSNPTT